MFFVPTTGAAGLAVLAVILSCIITAAVSALLAPVGMPCLTFPFSLACWFFILVGAQVPWVKSISLGKVTVPENHYRRYWASHRVHKTVRAALGKLSFLNMKTEADLLRFEQDTLPLLFCFYASQGDLEAVRSLALGAGEAKERISMADYDGRTCLHISAAFKQTTLVRHLLRKGVDPNARDRYGGTPLEDAIRSGSAGLVRAVVAF